VTVDVRRSLALGLVFLAVAGLVSACGGSPAAKAHASHADPVVAKVDGTAIRYRQVATRIDLFKLAAPGRAAHIGGPSLAEEVRGELVDEALVLRAARRSHLSVPKAQVRRDLAALEANFVPGLYPTSRAFLSALRKLGLGTSDLRTYVAESDLIALYLDRNAHPRPVTEAQVAAWYRAHETELRGPEQYHLRQILVATPTTARLVEKDLRAGQSFAALARRYSIDKASAARGGDLGWAPLNAYVTPFADAAKRLKVGQVSGIVKSAYGYHIIELLGIRPGSLPALASVASQIRSYLEGQAQQRAVQSVVAKLRAKAKVQIYPMPKA
jgi:hypothetical protein